MSFNANITRINNRIIKILKLGPFKIFKILFYRKFIPKIFSFFEMLGLHILAVHFYSPIPDTRALRRNIAQWHKEWDFTGIDFNDNIQSMFLQHLAKYRKEYNALPKYSAVREIGLGEGYGVVESHILHGFIRHFKPRNIIEIGSGISTYYSLNALRINRDSEQTNSQMICIEPYPDKPLLELSEKRTIRLIPKMVQEIDQDIFRTLEEDDILFIDSSHIVKINSDVCHIYLHILPNLRRGVVIHIHDIPFPHLSPDDVNHWVFKKQMFWTEPAILKAFLSFNNSFEILLCSSYLHYKRPHDLHSVFNIYDNANHFPSSIWLRKIL